MNPFDLVAILVLALAITLGFRSGAVPQVGGLVGAVAGGVAGPSLVAIVYMPAANEPRSTTVDFCWAISMQATSSGPDPSRTVRVIVSPALATRIESRT